MADTAGTDSAAETRTAYGGDWFWICGAAASIAAIVVAAVWTVICKWPASPNPAAGGDHVVYIVCAMGALGATVQMSGALAYYVGAGLFDRRWLVWYALRPFLGAALALIVYFTTVGGLLKESGGGLNLFGVAGLAGVAGLFTRAAMDKLRDGLQEREQGEDKGKGKEDKPEALALAGFDPATLAVAQTGQPLKIKGSGFTAKTSVTFDGEVLTPNPVTATELTVMVPAAKLATARTVQVLAKDGGTKSEPKDFVIT